MRGKQSLVFTAFLLVLIFFSTSTLQFVTAQDDGENADYLTGAGVTVMLQGKVLDTEGTPIEGAVVEIWQTDADGHYNHPRDTAPSDLASDFQYFGTATTEEAGTYAFQTIVPGAYEPRPVHIHVKVKIDGIEVLTTQFYFEEGRAEVEAEGAFGAKDVDTLFLVDIHDRDSEESDVRFVTGNLVVDLNGDAADILTPTAFQGEGPYYPVVDFTDYDNNLTDPITDEEPILPGKMVGDCEDQ